MSARSSFELSCDCGHEFEVVLWDAINVTEKRELKSKLLNGEINQIQCGQCKKRSYIEKNLLYHDMDEKVWIQMFPQSDRSNWSSLEDQQRKSMKKIAQSKGYRFRLAFGQQELLEKIRIFDSGLDDRIIEIIKLKVLEQEDIAKEVPDGELSFSQYFSDKEEIQFKLTSMDKNMSQSIVVNYDHYEEVIDSKEFLDDRYDLSKKIYHGMYISVNKTRILH